MPIEYQASIKISQSQYQPVNSENRNWLPFLRPVAGGRLAERLDKISL
jgi:hypothetical protein